MARTKVAITLDEETLAEVDELVGQHCFPNRSQAIQQAIQEKLDRMRGSRLAEECSKLDPKFEKAMAEEGMSAELSEWPEY